MKKIVGFISLSLVAASAQANIYFNKSNQTALVYFLQEADVVNAAWCEKVNEGEMLNSLKSTLASEKCQVLSKNGLHILNSQPGDRANKILAALTKDGREASAVAGIIALGLSYRSRLNNIVNEPLSIKHVDDEDLENEVKTFRFWAKKRGM